jgi:hypothetical protein
MTRSGHRRFEIPQRNTLSNRVEVPRRRDRSQPRTPWVSRRHLSAKAAIADFGLALHLIIFILQKMSNRLSFGQVTTWSFPITKTRKQVGLARIERLQIMLSAEELKALDSFRFRHRMPSRAAAVRQLFRLGLIRSPGAVIENAGIKSSEYGVLEGPRGTKKVR